MKFSSTIRCFLLVLNIGFVFCATAGRFQRQNAVVVVPPNTTTTASIEHSYKILSKGVNRIALALNFVLSKCGQNDENIIFSPLNIVQMMSTVLLGTAGQTERELTNILSIAAGSRVDNRTALVHRVMGKFLNKLTNQNPGGDESTLLKMTGGIFVQEGYPIKQSYVENVKSIYNNDVFNVDFTDPEASETINEWVREKTDGRITEIVDSSLDPTTKAIIAGALYFNGNWEYPFMTDATKWQPFYLTKDGKYGKGNILVEMMVNMAKVPYYEDMTRGFSAIGLPYKKKEVYMYLVVPTLRFGVKNLTACLVPNDIETIVKEANANVKEVFYVIPKMKLDTKFSLRSTLQSFGVRSLFDPAKANFSNIAEGVYASDILHKVDLEVNEVGTIAAAATTTNINRGGYLNFRADRPFFFFIYNVPANVMIFWGVVQKPTPNKQ